MEEHDMNGAIQTPAQLANNEAIRKQLSPGLPLWDAHEDQSKYDAISARSHLGLVGAHAAIAGVQIYSPLGGPNGFGQQVYNPSGGAQVFGGTADAAITKPIPPIATDGTTLRKATEHSAEFSRSPFSKDSVAIEEFGKTGRKPKCIFMSATKGHNLELFELDGHGCLWVRNTDDDGNIMQVRMSASERTRMKEIL